MNPLEVITSGSLFNKDVITVFGNRITGRNAITFRLRNDLDHDVIIECRKRRRSAGARTIKNGEYYSEDIYPYPWTEWWCSLRLSPGTEAVLKFLVHKANEESHTYEIRKEGIYKSNLDGCNRYFFMDWPEN